LCRYYLSAGAGGLAVGVHTTQFAIRDFKHGLLGPILSLAADEMARHEATTQEVVVRIAGVCGDTKQAVAEAAQAREIGYHAGLLSLAALPDASESDLIDHCRVVAEVLPLVGFYLQPAVGGRVLPFHFWRQFAQIGRVVAIKIAPFNRYRTLDVVRAVAEVGREDIALYTGNDDSIVLDLLTPFRFQVGGQWIERRIVGGLLGQWAIWTRQAVELLRACHEVAQSGAAIPVELFHRAVEITDANAVVFDVANNFAGCIAGIHEVLRRQGLLEGTWCLDPHETLSPGQAEEIDRVCRAYPHLTDDDFVAGHLAGWLRPLD
jgi:dihydrodipicolinate synthase/N-acetylneuraminate lyase